MSSFSNFLNCTSRAVKNSTEKTVIEPWLSILKGEEAVQFYKKAFGAEETYRLDDPGGGIVVRLSIAGAGFWISSDGSAGTSTLGGDNVRMILIVDDPNTFFGKALRCGGKEVWPVGEAHGWRMGRLVDPFGLHWEIGHQLD